MSEHCKTGTVNSSNADVVSVGAALGDAYAAGGLSKGYYRSADDALDRLDARIATLTEALEGMIRLDCARREDGHMTLREGADIAEVARRALNPSTPGKTGGGDGA